MENIPINQKALLSVKELAAYLGMGTTKATEYGAKCGAKRKYGKRTLYRRDIVDAAIRNEFMLDKASAPATASSTAGARIENVFKAGKK